MQNITHRCAFCTPTGGFTAVLANNFMTQALTEFAKIGPIR